MADVRFSKINLAWHGMPGYVLFMPKPKRTLAERIADADAKGSDLLYRANISAAKGKKDAAERLYERGQKWLDISNRLRGCGDGT